MENPKQKDPTGKKPEQTFTRLTISFRNEKGETLQEALEKAPKGTKIKIGDKTFTL